MRPRRQCCNTPVVRCRDETPAEMPAAQGVTSGVEVEASDLGQSATKMEASANASYISADTPGMPVLQMPHSGEHSQQHLAHCMCSSNAMLMLASYHWVTSSQQDTACAAVMSSCGLILIWEFSNQYRLLLSLKGVHNVCSAEGSS